MTPESVLALFEQALQLLLVAISIILLPALTVGLIVAMFQAATQINEMTLSFIPKLLVTLVTLLVAGPFLLQIILEFTQRLVHDIPFLIG